MIRARSSLCKVEPGKVNIINSTDKGNVYNTSDRNEVEIVIAGRNNGKYLKECITSALEQDKNVLKQTVPVTYVDDFSTDDSIEIAEALAEKNPNLKVIALDSQSGAARARNIGWQSTKADKIIFLDSDDTLPEDYVARHLAALTPNSPFAYGPAQAFGELTKLWPVPEWDNYDKWYRNTVNTSSIWARWALEAVGGWDENLPTMWDWDLALKCSKLGRPNISNATLNYRIHNNSHSANCGERVDSTEIREVIRKRNITITISSLISSRLGEDFLVRWLDNLAQCVKYYNSSKDSSKDNLTCNLNLYFHNRPPVLISMYSNIFSSIKSYSIQKHMDNSTEALRQESVSNLLAQYCAQAHSDATGDLIWLVEDDIFPKTNALSQLVNTITKGDVPPTAVSGLYLNRHNGEIAGGERYESPNNNENNNENNNWSITYLKEYPSEAFVANVVCTGCLLYYRDRPSTPKYWRSKAGYFNAHDWAWSEDCKNLGGTILIDPRVPCGHADDKGELLWINMN